jgi:hypothetical protein
MSGTEGLRQQDRGACVHRVVPVQHGGIQFTQGAIGCGQRLIAHQSVHPPELLHGTGNQRLRRARDRQVSAHRDQPGGPDQLRGNAVEHCGDIVAAPRLHVVVLLEVMAQK